jgi:hypothetical protein
MPERMGVIKGKAATAGLIATLFSQAGVAGTASIAVEVDDAEAATFSFAGVVSGTIAAGANLSKAGLGEGAYTAWDTGTTPGFQLVEISCDDDNSAGYLSTQTARFIIDGDESVACTFRYRRAEINDSSSPMYPEPAPAAPDNATTPEPADSPEAPLPDPDEDIPVETSCTAPDMVPRAGVWMVSNLPGTMSCSGMAMPLAPSQEPGRLELRECGWTVLGSGFSDDTADLTMRATDSSGKHYTGTIGGVQDGIPMNIDFTWTLESDSHITGSLYSQVSQQGMTCTMSRPFEMTFTSQ